MKNCVASVSAGGKSLRTKAPGGGGQAKNLQKRKKQQQAARGAQQPAAEGERGVLGGLSEEEAREKEEDENALWSLIKLFINCHTHENKEIMQQLDMPLVQDHAPEWPHQAASRQPPNKAQKAPKPQK